MRKYPLFNKTAFRKNATRFAPVWILYTLALLAMLVLAYARNGSMNRATLFTQDLFDLPRTMGVINLIYALIVAQLLFGDLYNSRMCNALHALPIRREGWFVTNVVSGLVFSLIPTLIMTLAIFPMLAGTAYTGAWRLPVMSFLAANLEFICFYGIAVLCVMCVGNRFTMVAGYGLMNTGAELGFWAVNMIYTPMLYGVRTPYRLTALLTPLDHCVNYEFFKDTTPADVYTALWKDTSGMTATFSLGGEWGRLWALAGVGIVMMALAVVLYRKRHLETAGDAVSFPVLVPVFQVLCTLFITLCGQYVVRDMLGAYITPVLQYTLLALCLIIGWFIGKMLVAKSTRVFGKQNWYGLGILGLVLALSLVGTHFDVLNLAERLPDPDKIESVIVNQYYSDSVILTEEKDIEKVLRLHNLALEDRVERSGMYVRGYDGTFVQVYDENDAAYDVTQENPELTFAATVELCYKLKGGKTMERQYNIWTEKEAGNILRDLRSRWDVLNQRETVLPDGTTVKVAEYALNNAWYISVNDKRAELPSIPDAAQSLMKAIKADCDEGTMIRDGSFHKGYFRKQTPETNWRGEEEYSEQDTIRIYMGDDKLTWGIDVYPDCENTVRWLQENGQLEDWKIIPNAQLDWKYLHESQTE